MKSRRGRLAPPDRNLCSSILDDSDHSGGESLVGGMVGRVIIYW